MTGLRLLVVLALLLFGGPSAPFAADGTICGRSGAVAYDFEKGAPAAPLADHCDHCALSKLFVAPAPALAPARAPVVSAAAPAAERTNLGRVAPHSFARGPPLPA